MTGWYLWDTDSNNAVGYFATRREAREVRRDCLEANPGWKAGSLVVFRPPGRKPGVVDRKERS